MKFYEIIVDPKLHKNSRMSILKKFVLILLPSQTFNHANISSVNYITTIGVYINYQFNPINIKVSVVGAQEGRLTSYIEN